MNRAFRSARGLTGGFTFLLTGALATAALSGCGAPSYHYVSDPSAGTYYKVPPQWQQVPQKDLNVPAGGSGPGTWWSAFDGGSPPPARDDGSFDLTEPFELAHVSPLSAAESGELSYDSMRDNWLPVTAAARQVTAEKGSRYYGYTGFTLLRDQTITAKHGVHGVRETFRYTLDGATDTFDEVVLTNADETRLSTLEVHCTQACYSKNQTQIDSIISAFTVESPA